MITIDLDAEMNRYFDAASLRPDGHLKWILDAVETQRLRSEAGT